MSRFLFWIILLGSLVYAATLVRDGQETLLGPTPPVVKTFLEQLPLPTAQTTAPIPRQPQESDPRLLRRLAMVEASLFQQQRDLERLLARPAPPPPSPAPRAIMDIGSVQVRWDDSGWRLEDYFAKRRLWNQRVTFATPFATPPRVALGMIRLETGPEGSIEVQAGDVDDKGFTLVLQAEEGRPREVKVQWLAFGEPVAAP